MCETRKSKNVFLFCSSFESFLFVQEEENERINIKLKESDDERTRLNRVINTLQDQLDKFKKLSTETKSKLDTTEVELNSLRKEIEQTKRQTKKQQQDQTQTDTKLNRALEEADRYKQQLNKMQQTTKEASEQDKKKIEQLTNENRRLEKQRLELMNAFKRQLKLIDILKKQKVRFRFRLKNDFSQRRFSFRLASFRGVENASICRRRILQSNRMEFIVNFSSCKEFSSLKICSNQLFVCLSFLHLSNKSKEKFVQQSNF